VEHLNTNVLKSLVILKTEKQKKNIHLDNPIILPILINQKNEITTKRKKLCGINFNNTTSKLSSFNKFKPKKHRTKHMDCLLFL